MAAGQRLTETREEAPRGIPVFHLAIGIATTLVVILVVPREGDPLPYYPIAQRVASGLIPYLDFPLEYPPLALPHIVLPEVVGVLLGGSSPQIYITLFSLISLALVAGTAGAVYWLAARRWAVETPVNAVLVFVAMSLAAAPLVIWRFDILPTFLSALALMATAARRPLWNGIALGLATATKLYPAFLLPVTVIAQLFERRWRPAVLVVLGAAVTVGAILGVIVVAAGPGAFSFLAYQDERGVEIESVAGGLALLADVMGAAGATLDFGFGAWQVSSSVLGATAGVRTLFEVALVLALLIGGSLSFRGDVRETGRVRPGTFVAYSLATLLVVILTNKVLSPQYLVWLLPFAALLPRAQSALLVVILALTTLVYPLIFPDLVAVRGPAVVALNVRNALLVVFFAWVVASPLKRGDVGQAADEARRDTEHEQPHREPPAPRRDDDHQ